MATSYWALEAGTVEDLPGKIQLGRQADGVLIPHWIPIVPCSISGSHGSPTLTLALTLGLFQHTPAVVQWAVPTATTGPLLGCGFNVVTAIAACRVVHSRSLLTLLIASWYR